MLSKFLMDHFELCAFFGMGFFFWLYYFSKAKKKSVKAIKKLEVAIAKNLHEPMTMHPDVDLDLCAGCGGCTRVCPEGDILQLINNKAVLVTPTKCVGHGACEAACPMGAITLVFGTKTRGMDIPRVNPNYETNVPGLYIAGELGGMGLIRNAVKQGKLAAEHAVTQMKPNVKADLDLLIVGAGPAGLAAGLHALKSNKRYKIIDQNSFGGTVANFPRQKIVMSHPMDLPIVGKIKLQGNKSTKEGLIETWNSIRQQTGLKVDEKVRFDNLKILPNKTFEVTTSKGILTAQRVILAMGVRGSPRRLGLPNEDLPKVTYNLIDAEQYKNKDIVVVGGGNAGVEAAQSLAAAIHSNRVHLLVRGAVMDRCNEDNQKIIFGMEKQGLVKIWFNSSVSKIDATSIEIKKDDKPVTLKNDYIFVFAGADVPFKFLMSLGVKIDNKKGEAIKKNVS